MKYAIIIPDGCADRPIEALGGRTPLQAASTPHLDRLASRGVVGRSTNVPLSMTPGSDVATLALLGYDPSEVYTGRAPLEAAALGIAMQENDWAFRCNTVTIEQEIMKSFTAGHISSGEAAELIGAARRELEGSPNRPIRFYPGVGYRHVMIWKGPDAPFTEETKTFPPHDYTDQSIRDKMALGPGGEAISRIFEASSHFLADHPLNRRRMLEGKSPCTHLWLWGQGRRPRMAPFAERFQTIAGNRSLRGAMITAVDLLRGIGKLLGWDIIDVPGATAYIDTDYAAKGRYAAEALRDHDLVCVHIEAPDESGHEGDAAKKVKSLEEIDAKVLPPILDALESLAAASGEGWRLLVSPDHPTPCALKTHTHDPVPWLWAGSDILPDAARRYDEPTAGNSPLFFAKGHEMISRFLASPSNVR